MCFIHPGPPSNAAAAMRPQLQRNHLFSYDLLMRQFELHSCSFYQSFWKQMTGKSIPHTHLFTWQPINNFNCIIELKVETRLHWHFGPGEQQLTLLFSCHCHLPAVPLNGDNSPWANRQEQLATWLGMASAKPPLNTLGRTYTYFNCALQVLQHFSVNLSGEKFFPIVSYFGYMVYFFSSYWPIAQQKFFVNRSTY